MLSTLKSADWFHPDGFPIAIEWRDPQEDYPSHNHDFSEIVIVTGGKGLHVTGHESWTLSTGDVFVIGGARSHAYRDLDRLKLVNVLFRPEQLRLRTADLARLPGYHAMFTLEPRWRRRHRFESRLRLTPSELGPVLALVEHLDVELRRREAGFGFMATALFMQLAGLLSRHYGHSRNADSRNLLRIAQAISHLETHFHEALKLATLAGMAQMSKRSFLRAFHSSMGLTPIAYLIQLRVHHAAAQLRSTRDSVTEIAFRCGFSDSNYFTRQFGRIMGQSPRRYRQQHHLPEARHPGALEIQKQPTIRRGVRGH
jgi:AraC-like DNA-binding protein